RAAEQDAGPCSLWLFSKRLNPCRYQRAERNQENRRNDPSALRLRCRYSCDTCEGGGTRAYRERVYSKRKIPRRLKTVLRFLFQTVADHTIERRRQCYIDVVCDLGRIFFQNRIHRLDSRIA